MDFLYKNFLKNLHLKINNTIIDESIHTLNSSELKLIKREYIKSLIQAGLLGLLGVCFYYFPIYYLPLFTQTITLSLFEELIPLPIYDILLCLVLTVVEIYLLTIIHLRMTHNIAVYSGFISSTNKEAHINKLTQIATGKVDKKITQYGLDPFQGTNKWVLFTINLLIKLKGFLANKILRYLIKRFAGRYAVKYVMDFIGAPVYMLLNMYATHIIYKNAKAAIFGHQLIKKYISNLPNLELNQEEKELIYHTLQLIAMSKRDFHSNHSLLTEQLIAFFKIPVKEKHYFNDSFYDSLQSSKKEITKICSDIFLLGLILDGHISNKEKKRIQLLQQKEIFQHSIEAIQLACSNFIHGKETTIIQLK
jgi:hypothetical protein